MTDRDEYPTTTDEEVVTGEIEETILDDLPRPAPPADLPLEADAADALDQRAEVDGDTLEADQDMAADSPGA
jgi:hypothetical protein